MDGLKLVLGTAVLVGPRAVLLRGPSGVGKSSLALALIGRDGPHVPVRLVADDAVHARAFAGEVLVVPPAATRGLIEIRGVGLRRLPSVARAALGLVVDLVYEPEDRLPEPDACGTAICGVDVPRIALDPREPAAAEAVMAVARGLWEGVRPPVVDDPFVARPSPT